MLNAMNTFLDFISNNALFATLLAAAIIAAIGFVLRSQRDRKDREAIYKFMLASKSESNFAFRNTQAIASHTKLTENRVAALCASHPKIRRNENEKQSWTLI